VEYILKEAVQKVGQPLDRKIPGVSLPEMSRFEFISGIIPFGLDDVYNLDASFGA
jgi:hypothetical protein